ncbi:hypothetical protein RYX36_016066 [Vicia faba]
MIQRDLDHQHNNVEKHIYRSYLTTISKKTITKKVGTKEKENEYYLKGDEAGTLCNKKRQYEQILKPSQIDEDLSSTLVVTRELEQLASKKHLNYENLCLLNGFLAKHPSLHLRDTSLSNRYKGYAYNLLAELLKFLQTHTMLDVLGSCRSELVELLEDACSFAFDKNWLDGFERRIIQQEAVIKPHIYNRLLSLMKYFVHYSITRKFNYN